MESSNRSDKKLTPIQEFYDGQNIFITGGTGFMGKLLIEKLLRSCPTIKCIYILIRPKKGKDVFQRQNELFEDTVFSKVRVEQPKFRDKIVCIQGDCGLPNLGITTLDETILIKEISIVFHVAATVRFNEKIKSATYTNVRGVKDMISLSKQMPNLKSFTHVSSVYSQCIHNMIEERFYDPPMDDSKLINLVDNMNEKLLDDITPNLLGSWPNTYVYTKSVAENIIKKQAGLIPIGIFRPGIVISTYREPVPGWVDNLNGPMGIFAGAAKGLIRSHHCDGSVKVCIVPGDLTTNALIVSAWDIASNRKSKDDIPIYNYVSNENSITYEEMTKMTFKYGLLTPLINAVWYCSFRPTKYRQLHLFYVYFLHLLPAFLLDTMLLCVAKKPRIFKMYVKLHKMLDALSYFSLIEWKFTNERWIEVLRKLEYEDRELFYCDVKDVVWDTYFKTFLLGIRLYALKDPIETLPQALQQIRRLYWIHQLFKLVIAGIFLMITWILISKLLVTFEYA
ncbi:PREDICTED: putative fatty acyl-CoA reductase CG5065 [Polistes canadensis]|uniref:putative fatty acyl-CoA reductase CG5065 n=1 Tax=Polistes canadensis TaxID=91411 RepID=UPI000718CF2E|nr:PREDICTED: putative fatty acyl-CoA reductase CG5065 [Polistes canadensis]